ncbi:ring-hydroxylating oxygenase subunit alpha [Bacterioplanes sanyensis]|uniref:aromatic ring-hydroxylating oxygenase subunit alpha n=1 Tax=Bacterioplanes sanyensis TaxID=1249553 RepID=UPI001673D37E|nr:aromatic ring-hydroxylating dioxygenase subunit alpha [Bacterioplanes sanyensis]GGY55704.1 ring-hydroxylating oxygenase subunit alpha [Bacterioplanes sanyensis]
MHNKQTPWHAQDPEQALTLPSRYFFDKDIFAQEQQEIFMKAWHFGCHVNELSEPGAYVVRDIFDQSVILMRDKDGEINAFHNVCQHRGNRLLTETRGVQKGTIRCLYHSWCYAHNGDLRAAPRSQNIKAFNVDDFHIPKVRLQVFAGSVYFNFDADAEDMNTLFPGAEDAIRAAIPKLDDMRLVQEDDVIVPANWKVIMDNSIEGYHFQLSGPHHIDLASLINFSDYKLRCFDNWWTYGAPPNFDAKEAYGVALDRQAEEGDGFFNIGLFPHNTFYQFPFSQCMGTFMMIPLDAERTILRFGYYSPYEQLPEVTQASIQWMNEDLGPEDIDLNITVQKGLHSLGYDQGRYMIDAARSNESEHLVLHFHRLVYQALHGQSATD